ncbi:hypothetical protein [Pandoraea fibrosis]|uniref:Uncharacterized protein n=1 Tax=Pandoraea fibrosis TaxID=1891094 RepID=A0A5E4Z0B2_9BURK|nr:hypothetical protein [Pandoraea fibrosis]VVE54624.1 hypothetical protein PFI31113_04915 [Pandoraea fibrosis]
MTENPTPIEKRDLLILIDKLIEALEMAGENSNDYKEIKKSKNIILNNDTRSIKKIKQHMFFDFRTIEDKMMHDISVNKAVDDICEFLDNHKKFST